MADSDRRISIVCKFTSSVVKFLLIYSAFRVTFISAAKVCHAVDQCSCKMDDGKYISLWDIDTRNKNKPRFQVDNILPIVSAKYGYNPCTGITIANSGCKDALVCETVSNEGKSASITLAYKKNPEVSYDSGDYIFTYSGSDKTSTIIVLKCDLTAQQPRLLKMASLPQNKFTTTLFSKCACPGACNYSPPSSGSSSSTKKLSTGSILCIILLVLVIVYFIGGLLINKYYLKKEGSDVIPNKSFWLDLPLLAKDGVVFTYSKIKGNKTEYQQI